MKTSINSCNAPAPIGPYSHAILAEGRFLFVSGQIPFDAEGRLAGNDIASQTRQCLENIRAIVAEAGGGMECVVKTTCMLADMEHFAGMNAVYSEYLGQAKPARAAFQVARLPRDVLIEIEAIAVL